MIRPVPKEIQLPNWAHATGCCEKIYNLRHTYRNNSNNPLVNILLKTRLLASIKAWPSHRIWSSSKLLIHIHGTNLFMRYDEEIGFSYAVHLTKFWEFYMDFFFFIFLWWTLEWTYVTFENFRVHQNLNNVQISR